jgi:hypothetical protein
MGMPLTRIMINRYMAMPARETMMREMRMLSQKGRPAFSMNPVNKGKTDGHQEKCHAVYQSIDDYVHGCHLPRKALFEFAQYIIR